MNIEAGNEINIEVEYQNRVSEMTPREKIARMALYLATLEPKPDARPDASAFGSQPSEIRFNGQSACAAS